MVELMILTGLFAVLFVGGLIADYVSVGTTRHLPNNQKKSGQLAKKQVRPLSIGY